MNASVDAVRRALLYSTALWAIAARGQDDAKSCAVVFLRGKSANAPSLAALARKIKSACPGRTPDMPWISSPGADKDGSAAMQAIARNVKEVRQQGFKRVILVGQGLGANAAIAYAGATGDADGVVALGGDGSGAVEGFAALPVLAPKLRQHIPLLWVVGSGDPLSTQGEAYAFAKAPPHPHSRYVAVKADAAGTPEAASSAVLEWIKSLD